MKSLSELCQEHPEHADHARETFARVHKLFEKLKETESAAEHHTGSWEAAKAAREKYELFYKAEIVESKNSIIRKLYEA